MIHPTMTHTAPWLAHCLDCAVQPPSTPASEPPRLELWYCRSGRMTCRLSLSAILCLAAGQALLRCSGPYPGQAEPLLPEGCQGWILSLPTASDPDLLRLLPPAPQQWGPFSPGPELEQVAALLSAADLPELSRQATAVRLALLEQPPVLLPADGRCCSPAQFHLAESVCRYLLDHMDRHFTIPQLSAQFHTSPTQIKLCFRKVYDTPVYSYIRTQKMRHAAGQLAHSRRSILDIAGDYGYDNGGKFAAAFRQVMGLSPTRYRKSGLS